MSYTAKRWAAAKRAKNQIYKIDDQQRVLRRKQTQASRKAAGQFIALPVAMAHDGANAVGKGIKKSYKAISGFMGKKNN